MDSVPFRLPKFADHAQIRAFFAAWQSWRGAAMVPRRSQIKLGDIPHLMSGCMLLDMHGPDRMVFRYAGSLYQDLYRFDFTGHNYLALTAEHLRDLRSRRLMAVVDQPAAAVWTTPGVDSVDFIGASVPVKADDPNQVPLLMQVLVHLRDLHHIRPSIRERRQREQVHLSDRFRYIDIGAGLPDTGVEA